MKRMFVGLILCITMVLQGCGVFQRDMEYYSIDEGKRLTVYTSHKPEVYAPIIKEFEERTGIVVEVKAGDTYSLMDEIEQKGGTACDVMFGGGLESYYLHSNCFMPYKPQDYEFINEKYVVEDDSVTPFSALPIVFVYNNKLVYPVAAPRTWEELLTDRWNGKIAFADPETSGSCYTALCTAIQSSSQISTQTIKAFANSLAGYLSSGSGAVLDDVESGKKLVGIILEETAEKRIAKDSSITLIYPKDGTSIVPDGTAIVKNARHLDNAKAFVDFTVSLDVQNLIVNHFCRRTVRTDVPDRENPKTEDILTVDYSIVWAANNREDLLAAWKDYYKGAEENDKVD